MNDKEKNIEFLKILDEIRLNENEMDGIRNFKIKNEFIDDNRLIFEEESDEEYEDRVKLIINFIIENICNENEKFIICIQEYMMKLFDIKIDKLTLINMNDKHNENKGVTSILLTNQEFEKSFEIIQQKKNG